jgi:hypothetical protein
VILKKLKGSVDMKKYLILLTSGLGFISVLIQVESSVSKKMSEGFSLLISLNHIFSYFTILTNTCLALFLALYVLKPNSPISSFFKKTAVSGAMALYISIVGLIYYALLANTWDPQKLDFFATHVLHGYVPCAYLFFWFKFFRKGDLQYKDTFKWILFPLIYFIYLLLRGLITETYPYFFINVTKYGYGQVIVNALVILVLFVLIGFLYVFVDRKFPVKTA